jgi:hypothetical protein
VFSAEHRANFLNFRRLSILWATVRASFDQRKKEKKRVGVLCRTSGEFQSFGQLSKLVLLVQRKKKLQYNYLTAKIAKNCKKTRYRNEQNISSHHDLLIIIIKLELR